MTEQVGYIGLGIMGRPAALNLMNAGYPVRVWARRDESMVPLIDAGATACRSPADVAESADIVFTNVSDTPDVEEVLLGEQGVIRGARPGSVVVDMSTISPLATQRMADLLEKKGVDMLDAPVSGGEKGAVSGTLSFMVGGKADVFDRVRPLFEVMGRNIVHCGDNGAGQVTKACNQIVITQTIAAVGEAFVFARKNGVDPARVREALLGGFAGSRVLEAHGQRMIDHDFNPGFKARLHRKDMRIVLETAAEIGVGLPGAALGTQYLNALVGAGDGELDSSAIYGLQELMARLNG
jgi:2-hydroxy-3-oxopropionate reductase